MYVEFKAHDPSRTEYVNPAHVESFYASVTGPGTILCLANGRTVHVEELPEQVAAKLFGK